MTLELKRISNRSATPDAADRGTPTERTGSLVINLCKVGVPITIPQPRSPQLRRFSFFLSHSRQGTRRKYRLQMGYFSTHVEANRWLKSLRGIYPGAFVSDVSAAQSEPLSDEEVLRRLEQDGADGRSSANENEAGGISLLRPEETGTRPGLRVFATSARHRPRGTFKETLEILGTIEFDAGSEEEINGTGMQDLRIELQKESPLKQISRRLSLWTRKR
jgi:hypothetical protein